MRDFPKKAPSRDRAARPKTVEPSRPLWMPDEELDRRASALETILLIALVGAIVLALCSIGGL